MHGLQKVIWKAMSTPKSISQSTLPLKTAETISLEFCTDLVDVSNCSNPHINLLLLFLFILLYTTKRFVILLFSKKNTHKISELMINSVFSKCLAKSYFASWQISNYMHSKFMLKCKKIEIHSTIKYKSDQNT